MFNIFFSETTWPVKVKFHKEPLLNGGTKVCPNGPGHMTKMAAMPICGKNLKKIFFSGTKRPMTLKLGMQHRVLEYYQVCSNDDPGLTLTYFRADNAGSCSKDLILACVWGSQTVDAYSRIGRTIALYAMSFTGGLNSLRFLLRKLALATVFCTCASHDRSPLILADIYYIKGMSMKLILLILCV